MPLFDYHCSICNRDVELLVPMNETDTILCMTCKSPMEKMLSSPAGINMTYPAKNSATGKTFDYKTKQKYYSHRKR